MDIIDATRGERGDAIVSFCAVFVATGERGEETFSFSVELARGALLDMRFGVETGFGEGWEFK